MQVDQASEFKFKIKKKWVNVTSTLRSIVSPHIDVLTTSGQALLMELL